MPPGFWSLLSMTRPKQRSVCALCHLRESSIAGHASAVRWLSRRLVMLRIDFTSLGDSAGEFQNVGRVPNLTGWWRPRIEWK